DDEVLLMRRAAGSRAYFGYNEFVARGMREMDPSFLFSFQLVREGHEQIWVMPNIMRPIPHGFHRHMAGLVGLIMYEPVEWRDIVPNEFIERVFNPITDIRLERLVDITLDNLADFGLDEPWIEIAFEEVHQGYEEGHAWGIFDNHRWTLIIGNPTDDSHEHFYAVYGGIPHVFTVSARDLNPVLALDYFWIINRFVSIINIWQVYDITIEGRDRSHFFEINTDYARGPAEHHFRPTVDGVNVQDNAFRWFYQLVAGLTFEILTEPHLPQGEPDLVIEFTTDDEWENGPIIRNEFFVYDPNFYSVIQENSARGRQEYSRLLVSRRDIDSLWRYLDRLIAGELDIAR
ncbi:MAG: DUF4340 domain-containing protein, partial [Defluviitaleaceae bacterium]|nr:DUF4340 domain-containing protein [Defluviitaleaceae bacterium]